MRTELKFKVVVQGHELLFPTLALASTAFHQFKSHGLVTVHDREQCGEHVIWSECYPLREDAIDLTLEELQWAAEQQALRMDKLADEGFMVQPDDIRWRAERFAAMAERFGGEWVPPADDDAALDYLEEQALGGEWDEPILEVVRAAKRTQMLVHMIR